ncbi:hydroxymethylglutaryl-CoA synthase family protein [Sphingomonas oligophenolica]|uniref:OB-fold domain-containing protein n=1 Tax=Sphingomonas oligophenolica TaxID=301154 RepID=A0ABU9Y6C1_9SPHN
MVGILALGAYVPRLRLQRAAVARSVSWFNPALAALGKGERALCAWDEDTITMAVEAARDCMAGGDRAAIGKVLLASTTFPYADRQNAGVVKEALTLDDDTGTLDVTGSQRAGTSALIVALDAAGNAPVLCVASENAIAKPASEAEFVNGDAAAAVLVGTGDTLADFLGSHSVSIDFVDHFRASDRRYAVAWESRWVRDEGYAKIMPAAIGAALAKFGIDPAAVDHFVMPSPVRGIAQAMARAAGIAPPAVCDPLQDVIGDAGCAQPLLLLADTIEKARPGEIILVVSFGQGCDILAFRATERVTQARQALGVQGWLKRRAVEDNYVKYLYWTGEITLDGGLRSELDLKMPLSLLYRERKTLLGLVGGRCRETGTVQFPKTRISVAQNARMVDTQDDYPLAELPARVVTFTADHLAASDAPPACYGMVEFDGGGRFVADFADVDAEGMAVGAPVRMMFRLKRKDERGFKHYFWKAVPDYRPAA